MDLSTLSAWQEPFRRQFDSLCGRAEQIMTHHRKTFTRPTLWFLGHGQTAGLAKYEENTISLNPTYCKAERHDMLYSTLPHEVAHILAYQLYGRDGKGHGAEWAAMYGALTYGAPKRTHDYGDVKAAARRLGC